MPSNVPLEAGSTAVRHDGYLILLGDIHDLHHVLRRERLDDDSVCGIAMVGHLRGSVNAESFGFGVDLALGESGF